MDILHKNQYTLLIISPSILLGMIKVSEKIVEKMSTHILYLTFFLNRAVYEIKWKDTVQPKTDRSQITVWLMRIACWILEATIFFSLAQQYPEGQGLLINEVSRSHTTTHNIR